MGPACKGAQEKWAGIFAQNSERLPGKDVPGHAQDSGRHGYGRQPSEHLMPS